MRYMGLLSAVMLLPSIVTFSQDVRKEDVSRADEVIAGYLAREAAVSRYCVAIDANRTHVSHVDAAKTFDEVIKYNVASDGSIPAVRYDDIRMLLTDILGNPTPLVSSLFLVNGKIGSGVNNSVRARFDADAKDIAEARFDYPCSRIDPWALPFADVGLFREEVRVIPEQPSYKEMIKPSSLTKFEENEFSIRMEFLVNKKYGYYKSVVFDKKCHMLPVYCRFFVRSEEGTDQLASTCTTIWAQTVRDKLVLPQRVSFSSAVGSLKKPSATKTYELELFWVLGEAFPAKVFNLENGDDFVQAGELNKEVMDNAAQLIVLKSALVDSK